MSQRLPPSPSGNFAGSRIHPYRQELSADMSGYKIANCKSSLCLWTEINEFSRRADSYETLGYL